MDETLVVWTIRDGAAHIVANSFVSLQSISFCFLEWLVSVFAGTGEIALRLPSVVAAAAALCIYYRLGEEIADRETGLLFAAIYLSQWQVVVEAVDARPYSLALLAHAAALLWLLRWLRSGRWRDGLFGILCAVAACHLHHLFLVAAPIEAAFVIWRIRKRVRDALPQCAGLGLVAALLLLPAVPQLLVIVRQGRSLSFAEEAHGTTDLLAALFPPHLLLVIVLVVAVEWVTRRPIRWRNPHARDGALTLAAALVLVLTLCFFAVSRLGADQLFLPRYLLPTEPGLVLLYGFLIRAIEPANVRRLVLTGILAVSILSVGGFVAIPNYQGEDWRGSARALPPAGAVLIYSGLIEARRIAWLRHPEHWSYLAAPVDVYRPELRLRDAFVLPFDVASTDRAYVETLLTGPLKGRQTVSLITRELFYGPSWRQWLSKRLVSVGYQQTSAYDGGRVQVRVFRLRQTGVFLNRNVQHEEDHFDCAGSDPDRGVDAGGENAADSVSKVAAKHRG